METIGAWGGDPIGDDSGFLKKGNGRRVSGGSTPGRQAGRWTRRIPYEPCDAVWMVVASISHERRRGRREGERQA